MLQFKNEDIISNLIDKNKKITKATSMVRLIMAIALVVLVICMVSLKEYIVYAVLSVVFFILFIIFVLYTNRYYKRLNHLEKKKLVYTLHKKRRNLEYQGFYDTGSDFLDKNDYKLSDLDIFGKKSLYQYLSIARTKQGRKALAKQLSNPDNKSNDFTKCILEMTNNEDVLDIEAALMSFSSDAKNADYDEFNSIVGQKINFKLLFFIPILSFIATLIYTILIFTMSLNPYIVIILLLINLMTSKIFLKNNVFDLNSTQYYNLCDSYIELSNTIINTNISNDYFVNSKNQIKEELPKLEKIRGIYSTLSTRKNAILNIGLNALCILDFWIIIYYNAINKNADKISRIFDAVAEIEVMLSFANIGIDGDVYSIPEENSIIEATDMVHPLVKDCVSNSITFKNGIVLTGSNMSGKTTFMRTLGINQLLFNAGSIVPSKVYKAPKMPIFTSLRANDMLSEGVSTFYAEILRMKLMNEKIEEGKCLILVDEIFKGTNASERISASFKVIEKFNNKNIFFIISTHDFELCEATGISNYHFSEYYENEQIYFDYIIKNGKCVSRNALYLLKMAKII